MNGISALVKEAGGGLSCGLAECLSSMQKPCIRSPAPHKPGMAVHVCNPGNLEAETGGSEVHVQLTYGVGG